MKSHTEMVPVVRCGWQVENKTDECEKKPDQYYLFIFVYTHLQRKYKDQKISIDT